MGKGTSGGAGRPDNHPKGTAFSSIDEYMESLKSTPNTDKLGQKNEDMFAKEHDKISDKLDKLTPGQRLSPTQNNAILRISTEGNAAAHDIPMRTLQALERKGYITIQHADPTNPSKQNMFISKIAQPRAVTPNQFVQKQIDSLNMQRDSLWQMQKIRDAGLKQIRDYEVSYRHNNNGKSPTLRHLRSRYPEWFSFKP